MSGQFRGKRLFAGRLFAGRLFGPAEQARQPVPVYPQADTVGPRLRRRRRDKDDDVLLFLLR